MEQDFPIEAPSDWPKEFTEIKKIDSLLRCSICYDYFNIAVIVPICSHNYCSLCIRKHVSYKKFCPSCNVGLDDNDLRPNRVLDELVDYFKSIRRKLLACTLKWIGKVVNDDEAYDEDFEETPHFRNHKSKDPSPEPCSSKIKEENGNNNRQNTENFVNCPVCESEILEKTINIHLDVCLRDDKRLKRKLSKSPEIEGKLREKRTFIRNGTPKVMKEAANNLIHSCVEKSRKPLPKMCLDLLNEKQLRSKLKSFNLPSKGDKQVLKKRLKEFVLLYNSECDSANPMSANNIIEEVMKREKEVTMLGYKPKMVATHDHRISIDQKLQVNLEHSKENNEQFQSLVEDVKRRNPKKTSIKLENEDSGSVFGQTYKFSIISPQKTTDQIKIEDFEGSTYQIDGNDFEQKQSKESIFETTKKIKKMKPKTIPKKSNDNCTKKLVKKQQSSSMLEKYFFKVKKSAEKKNSTFHHTPYSESNKIEEILVQESDSNSDHELFLETSQSIPESPDIFESKYNSSSILKKSSPRSEKGTVKGLSPIFSYNESFSHNQKKKKPRKIFSSDESEKQKAIDEVNIKEIRNASINTKNDTTFDCHLDKLVDDVFEQGKLTDSDATLSDVEAFPDPPSEYDFTFTDTDFD